MPDTAWICTPPIYPGYARSYSNSFRDTSMATQAVEWSDRNWSGEPLAADCFPKKIFATKATKNTAYKLPHLFSDATFWVVSGLVASHMRNFDLGNGNLYPVEVLQVDRETKIGDEWFCVNFGNRKNGIVAEQSVPMYDTYVYGGTKAWQPHTTIKDDDIAVSVSVLNGAEIWKDPCVADAFFLSDSLGKALKKAKLEKAFHMHTCRIV